MSKKYIDPYAEREAKKYDHPIPSRECICNVLQKHKDKSINFQNLATLLALDDDNQLTALGRRLKAMVRDGQLIQIGKQQYMLCRDDHLIKGHIETRKNGATYFIPNNPSKPDLRLPAKQAAKVFTGDIVLASATVSSYDGHQEGVIVKVLERAYEHILGRYHSKGETGFVEPMNQYINQSILIPESQKNNAVDGEIVMVRITDYPDHRSPTIGKITEILGDHMAAGMEVQMAIRDYDLPYQWSEEINHLLENYHSHPNQSDKQNRVDLTHLPFVTIDGNDSQDFDDAVYCEKRIRGWRLYVAIADVSHYVQANTALDHEALNRGNSVYFPGKVIPMLPKKLSNDLCSLKPNVDRLCVVCEMKIAPSGKMTRYNFYSATINSHARLTYNKVADFFNADKNSIDKALHQPLQTLYDLYQSLAKQRLEAGAITFETTETKIVFDKNRKIKKIVQETRNDAHKLIEECMLRANIAAAKFLNKHKTPTLYRVHAGPKPEALNDLRHFLGELGLNFNGGDKPEPRHYTEVLKQIASRPDYHIIQVMLLRSMSRAFYSTDNIGHFSLSFKEYLHFTSPIRRYPDLIVHRAIKSILSKEEENTQINVERLVAMAEHCSMTERRADEATRSAISWLKCEYMLNKVGEKFFGIISAVTGFGLFVELENIFVEGLVHVRNLSGDFYRFDIGKQRLQGCHSGKTYCLGDRIEVMVTQVDLDARQIDFELVTKKKTKRSTKRKRKRNG
ncbi:MAG: ribonuclease R [Pseudomonadota bacterium]